MLWDLKDKKQKLKTEHTGLGKLQEPAIINTSEGSRSGPGFPVEGVQARKRAPALYFFFQNFQKKNMQVKIGPKGNVHGGGGSPYLHPHI